MVGSTPTHGRNKISVVRLLSGLLSPFGKWVPALGGRGPPQCQDLKYESMFFADWLWSVITKALGLKMIPDLLDTNSTHTGIAYAHLTTPHSCDYMSYVRYVGERCEKQQKSRDYFG